MQSPNGARNGSDDDFVQKVDHFISREHQKPGGVCREAGMCTSGSRRGSTELVPSLRSPGERFVIARKLLAGRGRHPVSRSIRAVRRGYPPEQPDALAVGKRRHPRHYVVGGQ